MDTIRKNVITRSEYNDIDKKLTELIDLIDKYEYLYRDIDDLLCLSHSLVLLNNDRVNDLKIVD